jgi:hypothetical protein
MNFQLKHTVPVEYTFTSSYIINIYMFSILYTDNL